MKKYILILILTASANLHASNSYIYNSNGTTSTVINSGSTSYLYNSDGSNSTIINSGNASYIYNSDGTSSTILRY